MAALGRALASALPGFIFESPDAPHGGGPRREWFNVIGLTRLIAPSASLQRGPALTRSLPI